jgi:feruloyl esterase
MIYVMGRALERWVEDGITPEQVIATKYKSGSNPVSGVARTRPLCPYPRNRTLEREREHG